jgi:hypothetical protein
MKAATVVKATSSLVQVDVRRRQHPTRKSVAAPLCISPFVLSSVTCGRDVCIWCVMV